MACDCDKTNIDCTCPDPSGVAAAKINNIVSTETGITHAINGAGYTMTLYTNTSGGNQRVYAQTNMYITSNNPHQITTTYLVNGVAVTYAPMLQNAATVKTDHTHFLNASNLANGDVLSVKIQSSDATGVLVGLVSFIYKYDY